MTVGFNRLIGINKISGELGKKNLTIKFVNYEATNIDKVAMILTEASLSLRLPRRPAFGFTSKGSNNHGLFRGLS